MPGEILQKDAFEGKVHLGGCCIVGDQPDRHSNACEHQWGKTTEYCEECLDVVQYCKCYEDMYK